MIQGTAEGTLNMILAWWTSLQKSYDVLKVIDTIPDVSFVSSVFRSTIVNGILGLISSG